jgi:hypothetical protein
MSNTPSKAEIEALAQQHLKAFAQFTGAGEVWFEGEVEFARAVLAKWGTQPQAGAVPQGWKAVPVNPTPEMWKAAKTVPDPNPPYPPHYGLVWDAMLAASPTPPAEQKACDTQLFKFYGVSTTAELIAAQARHIEKLQAKIPPTPSFVPQRVREG